VAYARKLLAEVGLEPERLEMYFLSSAEGTRFAEIATEMTERARQLGPNPLRNGRDMEPLTRTEVEE
jgi:F420-non-reducing hydrogenase iron-sulfur subunit